MYDVLTMNKQVSKVACLSQPHSLKNGGFFGLATSGIIPYKFI